MVARITPILNFTDISSTKHCIYVQVKIPKSKYKILHSRAV